MCCRPDSYTVRVEWRAVTFNAARHGKSKTAITLCEIEQIRITRSSKLISRKPITGLLITAWIPGLRLAPEPAVHEGERRGQVGRTKCSPPDQ